RLVAALERSKRASTLAGAAMVSRWFRARAALRKFRASTLSPPPAEGVNRETVSKVAAPGALELLSVVRVTVVPGTDTGGTEASVSVSWNAGRAGTAASRARV